MQNPTHEVVHYYDTNAHAIPCGVRGFEERSTKYPRSVTCSACLRLIASPHQESVGADAAV